MAVKATRKLQMAAELIEDAADDIPNDEEAARAAELAQEVDELRSPVHMQLAQLSIAKSR